jgi:hypothetical protein
VARLARPLSRNCSLHSSAPDCSTASANPTTAAANRSPSPNTASRRCVPPKQCSENDSQGSSQTCPRPRQMRLPACSKDSKPRSARSPHRRDRTAHRRRHTRPGQSQIVSRDLDDLARSSVRIHLTRRRARGSGGFESRPIRCGEAGLVCGFRPASMSDQTAF